MLDVNCALACISDRYLCSLVSYLVVAIIVVAAIYSVCRKEGCAEFYKLGLNRQESYGIPTKKSPGKPIGRAECLRLS